MGDRGKFGKKNESKKIRWTKVVDLRTGKTTKVKIYDGRNF